MSSDQVGHHKAQPTLAASWTETNLGVLQLKRRQGSISDDCVPNPDWREYHGTLSQSKIGHHDTLLHGILPEEPDHGSWVRSKLLQDTRRVHLAKYTW